MFQTTNQICICQKIQYNKYICVYIYVYIYIQFYSQNHYKLTTIFRLKIAIS